MAEILDDFQSTLFTLLITKNLPHPTSRKFSRELWDNEWKKIKAPNERDMGLFQAATFYGNEIKTLREFIEPKLFLKLSSRTGKILCVAIANSSFFNLETRAKDEAIKRAKIAGLIRFDGMQALTVENSIDGNKVTPDAIAADIADTLPHCLERTNNLPVKVDAESVRTDLFEIGAQASLYLSVEQGLRKFWLQVLWENWKLAQTEEQLHHTPTNNELASLWIAWTRREELLANQGASLDYINDQQLRKIGQFDRKPILSKTVTGIGGNKKNGRRFNLGDQSSAVVTQAQHTANQTIIEECYLGAFLDAPLPSMGDLNISCNLLQRAWYVIRDAANVLQSKIRASKISDLQSVEQYSLLIRSSEIRRAIQECLSITSTQASAVTDFLSIETSDLPAMFNNGFWSRPLLKVDNDNTAIVVPTLTGNSLRRVEHWLSRGGLSDHLSDARRGGRFEVHVRDELQKAILKNQLFQNSKAAKDSISAKPDGEQIDLLIKLRNTIFVGEVKCFLGPIESIERYNYLRKLEDACEQALRKSDWLRENMNVASSALDLPLGTLKTAAIVPLVVTNQGYGFSLAMKDVQVVDFHFLKLFLGSSTYNSGAAFHKDRGEMVVKEETLYRSEIEAEENYLKLFSAPPALKVFTDALMWSENSFPRSDGTKLLVSACRVGKNLTPMDNEAISNLFE